MNVPSNFQNLTYMIVLSWNIRGLNARIKRSYLKKIILLHKPNLILIQESKMESINRNFLKSVWNEHQIELLLSPSMGNSGGLITMWQPDFFKIDSQHITKHWLAICGTIKGKNFTGCIINVYNSCDIEERATTWEEIKEYSSHTQLPCLLCGDFNEILHISERGSNLVSQRGMTDFTTFVNDLQLTEVTASNGWFTWFRGASKSKLDRLLVSPEWLSTFPHLQLSLLKRSLSDHCPLLTISSSQNWGLRPFRFQNMWLSHPGCIKLVEEVWQQHESANLIEKLQQVKVKLKSWNSEVFGLIDHNINALENSIHRLDMAASSRSLEPNELEERRNAEHNLWMWLKRKEQYWAQNSRDKWLKEGDKNTRYFHTTASIRKRQNTITSLNINGANLSDCAGIKREAVKYFKNIFKEEFPSRPVVLNSSSYLRIKQTF